jgi:transglutaminase-like putative cysteine protease
MGRTIALSAPAAALLVWSWSALERPHAGTSTAMTLAALAITAALVPARWLRPVAAAVAFLYAMRLSLGVWPVDNHHFFGRVLARFDDGLGEFYDVRVPFDPADHPRMHGVVLLAVFAFTLAVALALAARRPLLAGFLLMAGAAWPITLAPPSNALLRGGLLLAVLLWVLLGMTATLQGRLVQAAAAGTAVIVVSLAASSSPAVAKQEFLHWQRWDLYNHAQPRVSVRYVWDASYSGLRLPKKKTTLFRVRAPSMPTYWRATTLDVFLARVRGWVDSAYELPAAQTSARDEIVDPLAAPGATDPRNWIRQQVKIEGLLDDHVVGASIPVAFAAPGLHLAYSLGGGFTRIGDVPRGTTYHVWSYQPRPTPTQLARTKPVYPDLIETLGSFLSVDAGVYVPPFGTPNRDVKVEEVFRDPLVRQYRPLYETARRIVGNVSNPYAATVRLEGWLRSDDFTYDAQPPRTRRGTPPLVDFVMRTRRGYCQHFAGAMALMLRYLGIPARVAAGFTSGRYDGGKGEWTVTDHEAHTWVEVWFRGYGWLPFDPTPGRGELEGRYTTASPSFDLAGASKALTAGGGLPRIGFDLSTLDFRAKKLGPVRTGADVPRVGEGGAPLPKEQHSHVGRYLAWLGVLIGGIAALIALTKVVVRRGRYLTRDPRRSAAACIRELVDFVADQGRAVPPGATISELAALVAHELAVDARPFAEAAESARYGTPSGAAAAATRARLELRRLRSAIRRELTIFERLAGLLSLRSLATSRN